MSTAKKITSLPIDRLDAVFTEIKRNGVMCSELRLEYNKQLFVRVPGAVEDISLSSDYYNKLKNQTKILVSEVLEPLYKFVGCVIDIKISIDDKGEMDMENLEIGLHNDVPPSLISWEAVRGSLTKFLPFVEHIHTLEVRGIRHRMSAMHVMMKVSVNDIKEALEHTDVIMPRVKKQWGHILDESFDEAKLVHSYSVEIPCFDGELLWKYKTRKLTYKM